MFPVTLIWLTMGILVLYFSLFPKLSNSYFKTKNVYQNKSNAFHIMDYQIPEFFPSLRAKTDVFRRAKNLKTVWRQSKTENPSHKFWCLFIFSHKENSVIPFSAYFSKSQLSLLLSLNTEGWLSYPVKLSIWYDQINSRS